LARKILLGYLLVFWATLLSRTAVFLARSWGVLHYPFELDYGEGVVIWQAQQVTDLKLAFRSISQFPHIVFHYPPLFHLTARLVGVATGDLLTAGRLVSVLSTLGISILSGLIVWNVLPRKMPLSIRATGAFTGAALCFSVESVGWAVYMRVDVLAIFLEFAGIHLYLRGMRRPSLEYAGFLCFFLALYTKQTMIAGPLACGVVACLIAPRRAVRQLGLLMACSGVTLAALVLLTRGQFFRHLFLYNRNPLSMASLVSILRPNILAMGSMASAALALPVAFMAGLLVRPKGRLTRFRAAMLRSPSHRFMAIGGLFLVFAVGVSLTAAKSGASQNYMLEWNLAACPLAATLFASVLHWWQRQPRLLPTYVAILLSPVLYTHAFGGLQPGAIYEDPDGSRRQAAAAVLERIKRVEGPVYSTDMVLLYRAGKALAAEPAIISVLAEQGQWDDTPFVKRLESGYFDLIVSSRFPLSDRLMFSPAVADAIARAYEPTERIGSYTLYRPRDPIRSTHVAK
jgi:hypothetical protein